MSQVGIASGSQIAADAGATIAAQGGNAVDAALAATLVSMCTDLGVMAPGGSGFITIWSPDAQPVVIDAYGEMPGRGLPAERVGKGMQKSHFYYGGRMSTVTGYGSVATPGIFAGLAKAAELYGRLPWRAVVEPARRWVQDGFPLTGGAAEYLNFTHEAIFSWHPESARVIYHADGRCLQAGDIVRIPELAQTLEIIGEQGADSFYTGAIGQQIAQEIQAHDGLLTALDLQAYEAIPRTPIQICLGDWEIVTNPPPAIGGACVAAMLLLLERQPLSTTSEVGVRQMAQIQQAVLNYRDAYFETSGHGAREAEVARLLQWARQGDWQTGLTSPSTIHTSTVDNDRLACAITASAGYGSGVMVTGTGLWLNNSLGEIELHPQGLQGLTPGTRLVSNMAPTIARHADGRVLAIGSPGASRITTAIAQVLHHFLHWDMSLAEAINRPRMHVEIWEEVSSVAFEAGLPVETIKGFGCREFPPLSMYFGGVQGVLWHRDLGLVAAADPRRAGGVAYGG